MLKLVPYHTAVDDLVSDGLVTWRTGKQILCRWRIIGLGILSANKTALQSLYA